MGQGQEGCTGSPSPSPQGHIQPLPATTFRHRCSKKRGEKSFGELEKVAF